MTTKRIRGLLVATAAVAMLATGAHAASAPKLSSGVQKQLVVAQKAAGTKDWPAAKAALDAASQVSDRSDYDNYMIATFSIFVDANSGDMNGAAAAAQAAADSPAQPEDDKAKNLRNAVSLSLQVKQFDKGMIYAKTLAATNPTDPVVQNVIAQAYYFGGDFANAQVLTQKQIDGDVAAHRKPDRNTLEMLLSAQSKQKDEAGAEKTLEELVADYNDPGDWQQIIDVTFSTKGLRDIDGIWLGRLLFLSGATVNAQDATMIGSTASHLTFYGDAETAQKAGGSGYPDPTALAAKDKASMAASMAAAAKQPNGNLSAKLAEALYSYGMYPEAEAQARLAMSKGGATDPSEPPMVLGQALVAQGKYDDAIAAFGQVSGGGPATPRAVRLWVDYANIKKGGGAATPATATAQ